MFHRVHVWWPALTIGALLLICLVGAAAGVAAADPVAPTPTPTAPPFLSPVAPATPRDPRPLPERAAAPPPVPLSSLADGYEPDNTPGEANEISGASPEERSIDPAGDDDWIRVTLEVASAYEFWAPSVGDLEMWLYDANMNLWDYNDDYDDTADPYIFGLCGQNALPAGVYYILIQEFDDSRVVNPYELYSYLSACEGDLTPVAPGGYQFPVVPNSIKGTKTAGTVLYANHDTYFDWFFQNIGDNDINTPFIVEVFVDGHQVAGYQYNGYAAGGVGGFADWLDGGVEPGWHTLSIEVDAGNDINEFNESNNYWEKEFYWAEVTGWWGEYFNADEPGGDPVLVHDDPTIDFNWSNNAPGPGVNADFFSARWTRRVTFQEGVYLFHLVRDDGMRVWDNGTILYDGWPDDVEQTSFTRVMTGGAHNLQVDFHERQGGAVARFWWERCYKVTTAANPAGYGVVELTPSPNCGTGHYTAGTLVSARATTNGANQFVNWSGDLSGAQNPQTLTVNSDKSVTANFALPCYTLALLVNPAGGGSIDPTPDPNCAGGKYTAGTTVSLDPAPAQYYAFANWSGDLSGTQDPKSVTMDGDRSVTANFTRPCYTLTLLVNPSGSGSIDPTPDPNCAGGKYTAGTTVSLLATAVAGHQFANWSGALTGAQNPKSVTMDGDETVTANFIQPCYSLTLLVNPSGSGSIDPTPDPNCAGGKYTAGTTVSLLATAVASHQFANWSGVLTGAQNPKSVTMNGDKTVTANFTRCYALTVTTDPPGLPVTLNLAPSTTCGAAYVAGTVVTMTLPPLPPGYTFIGWGGDVSGAQNPKTITMNSDKQVVVRLSRVCYTLTTATSPGNGGSISPLPAPNCDGNKYTAGTTVSLQAVPAQYYAFANWSGDLTGAQNPKSVTMNGDRSVTANFTQPCYSLTLLVTPASGGSAGRDLAPNCAGDKYTAGTILALTAQANNGYTFNSWSGDAGGSSASIWLIVNSDKTVIAQFSDQSVTTYTMFIPLADHEPCFSGQEQEPNNSRVTANGPICLGPPLSGRPDNGSDYYLLELDGPWQLNVELVNIQAERVQLLLYGAAEGGEPIDKAPRPPYQIDRALGPGIYYLRVAVDGQLSGATYTLFFR